MYISIVRRKSIMTRLELDHVVAQSAFSLLTLPIEQQ